MSVQWYSSVCNVMCCAVLVIGSHRATHNLYLFYSSRPLPVSTPLTLPLPWTPLSAPCRPSSFPRLLSPPRSSLPPPPHPPPIVSSSRCRQYCDRFQQRVVMEVIASRQDRDINDTTRAAAKPRYISDSADGRHQLRYSIAEPGADNRGTRSSPPDGEGPQLCASPSSTRFFSSLSPPRSPAHSPAHSPNSSGRSLLGSEQERGGGVMGGVYDGSDARDTVTPPPLIMISSGGREGGAGSGGRSA